MTGPAESGAAPYRLRVLVVDDEAFARQRVRRLLGEEPGVEVVGECAGGREAIDAVRRERPDLLLLDVQMPETTGFDVVRELAEDPAGNPPLVVFVTAYDSYAVQAFDVRALDYLLKPVDAVRLGAAIGRARAYHQQATAAERHARLMSLLAADAMSTNAGRDGAAAAESSAPGASPARLLVKDDGRMYFVRTAEVDWVESFGNYVKVHAGSRTHLVRMTMAALERALDPAAFARIHRSTIVNLDRVKEIQPWFSGDYVVLLTDGTKLRLSRAYRERLERRGIGGR
jgi:two-component system LytT family response regulator